MKTSTNRDNLMHHCKTPKLRNSAPSFHMFAIRITSCLVVLHELGFVTNHNMVTSHTDCWPQNVPSWCGWIGQKTSLKMEVARSPERWYLYTNLQSIKSRKTKIFISTTVRNATQLCCFTIRTITDGHSFGT